MAPEAGPEKPLSQNRPPQKAGSNMLDELEPNKVMSKGLMLLTNPNNFYPNLPERSYEHALKCSVQVKPSSIREQVEGWSGQQVLLGRGCCPKEKCI